jgi:hypothetical protein
MAVHHEELKPGMCGLDLTWGWYCDKPALPGQKRCEKHAQLKCRVPGCAGEIIELCSNASSFVCGHPVCSVHGCPRCGR